MALYWLCGWKRGVVLYAKGSYTRDFTVITFQKPILAQESSCQNPERSVQTNPQDAYLFILFATCLVARRVTLQRKQHCKQSSMLWCPASVWPGLGGGRVHEKKVLKAVTQPQIITTSKITKIFHGAGLVAYFFLWHHTTTWYPAVVAIFSAQIQLLHKNWLSSGISLPQLPYLWAQTHKNLFSRWLPIVQAAVPICNWTWPECRSTRA